MARKLTDVDHHISNVIHLATGEHGFMASHVCTFAGGKARLFITLTNSTSGNRRRLQDLASRLLHPSQINPYKHSFAIGELRYRAGIEENKPDLLIEIKRKHIAAFRRAWEEKQGKLKI